MIRISVVVCTHNRANMLEGALDSLIQQSLDKTLYEIIVVDNGSMDNTSQVVKEIQNRHADYSIVLMYEPILGLGHARNVGVRHSKGEYIAFIDDDARANADWLETALHCFEKVQPTPLAIGGVIMPFYESPKPAWFRDEYEIRTWGSEARFLSRGESFSGSNMIFRKEAIEKYGGFDVKAGVKGNYLFVGEEAALYRRIWLAEGDAAVLYYSPQLVILHAVPDYKMRVSYRWKRGFVTGQWSYLQQDPRSLRQRIGLVLRLMTSIGRLFAAALRELRRYPTCQNWAVETLTHVAVQLGSLTECLGLHIRVRQG